MLQGFACQRHGAMCNPVSGAPVPRVSTFALPGIELGGRIVTLRMYGPA
jgi:hypothetical protein